MSAGQESGPEDPQGSPAETPSENTPSAEDWADWRSGPGGYSKPVPPEPATPAGAIPADAASEDASPDGASTQEASPDVGAAAPASPSQGSLFEPRPLPERPAPVPPQPHISHEEPLAYERARPHAEPGVYERSRRHEEPRAYGAPGGYQPPPPPPPAPTADVPTPRREPPAGHDPGTYRGARPYVGGPDQPGGPDQRGGPDQPGEQDDEAGKPHRGFEALGAYDAAQASEEAGYQGSDVYDEPASPSSVESSPGSVEYGVLGRYNSGLYGPSDDDEPGGYLQQDTGEGPDADDYGDFWRPPSNRGGGAHASRTGPRPDPAEPPPPGGGSSDTSVYRGTPIRRQAGFLLTAAIVVLVVIVVVVFFLVKGNGKPHHPAAGTPGHSTSPTSAPPSSPASTPAAPPLTEAGGHLGVPRSIGSLRLNALLTQKFVGPSIRQQDANSFFIPDRDVASGFYTTDPSVASFTASEPRLMFLVAYLAGSGNAQSALHSFMTNHTFYGQHQIQPGSMGGVAACGYLAGQSSPVAHCMWADADTYADFYAWNSKPDALAQTMLATRPQVELKK